MLADADIVPVTYSAGIVGLVAAASPTDIFTITGSATKTIKVLRFTITATATSEAVINLLLIKRSTADTGGTSTAQTAVKHDSIDTGATATVLAYTANPTVGTLVGNMRVVKIIVPVAAPGQPGGNLVFMLEPVEAGKPWLLRGTGEVLAVNLNAATLVGNNFDIDVTWMEV